MPLKEKNNMKRILILFSGCLISLAACVHAPDKEVAVESQKLINDSVSKAEQKHKVDSLKKLNPLLILPPDSMYSGEYTDKYPNGIIKYKGLFRFGERHGQWLAFYPDGSLWSELHFDNGLRHGPNMTYFENGKMRYSGSYKNDMQDSVWTYYDSTGKVAQKVRFKKDKIVQKLPLK